MPLRMNPNRRMGASPLRFVFTLVVLAAAIPPGNRFAQEKAERPAAQSLYQRMGGYDMIAAVVDDFLAQIRTAPDFARFGGGRGRDSLARSRQLVVDQICAMAGGPCTYIGRDMRTAHAGLRITGAEWDSMMAKYKNSLEKFKIGAPEQRDFLALIEQLRPAIVEVPKEEKPKTQN